MLEWFKSYTVKIQCVRTFYRARNLSVQFTNLTKEVLNIVKKIYFSMEFSVFISSSEPEAALKLLG